LRKDCSGSLDGKLHHHQAIVSFLPRHSPTCPKTPRPFTPHCGLKIAELAQQFFPPGVVQALSGNDDLGPRLTAHPGIDKISFTGSSTTGKKVVESASKTLKRVTLELYVSFILPEKYQNTTWLTCTI